jgi:hypothetical protein
VAQKETLKEKSLSGLLMFILGFVGFSILGAIILVILISLGVLPSI